MKKYVFCVPFVLGIPNDADPNDYHIELNPNGRLDLRDGKDRVVTDITDAWEGTEYLGEVKDSSDIEDYFDVIRTHAKKAANIDLTEQDDREKFLDSLSSLAFDIVCRYNDHVERFGGYPKLNIHPVKK